MSDAVWGALIVAIGTFCNTGLIILGNRDRTRKAEEAVARHAVTTAKLDEVQNGVNGQTQALLKVTGESQKAIGNLEGHAEAATARAAEH